MKIYKKGLALIFSFFIYLECLSQTTYSVGVGYNTSLISSGEAAGSYRINGEVSLSKAISLRADFRKGPFGHGSAERSDFGNIYNIWINGWGLDFGPRFYLRAKKKGGPFGFYIGPHFVYRRATEQFSGYLTDNRYYLSVSSFPYADIKEKGNGYGAGLAVGWKFVKKIFFLEPGFSVDFANVKYPSSANHATISSRYETSELFTINAHITIGLTFSKGTSLKTEVVEEKPYQKLTIDKDYTLLTLYTPLSLKRPDNEASILVNDTVVGKFAPGNSYTLTTEKDSALFKVTITGMKSVPLQFQTELFRHYYLRILPPKNNAVNIPRFEFVKPEVGEYDLKMILRKKGERNLKE